MSAEEGTVGKGLVDLLGDRDVGKEHELLHHGVGVLQDLGVEVDGVVRLAVHLEPDLGGGKGQGPALCPALLQELGQLIQPSQAARDGVGLLCVVDPHLRLRVREGGSREYHALGKRGGDDLCARGHLPDAGEGEPLLPAQDGAQVGAEELGDHVDALVREVHRGAPVGCLLVQFRSGSDEVGDVRNVHTHLQVAVLQLATVEGVVNVCAPRGVHTAYVQVPEVCSLLHILPRYGPRHGGEVGQHGLGEGIVGDIVLQQEHLILRGLVPYYPKLPHKVAPGEARGARPRIDAHHNPLPQKVLGLAGLNEYPRDFTLSRYKGVSDPLHARTGEEGPTVGTPVALDNTHDSAGRLDHRSINGRGQQLFVHFFILIALLPIPSCSPGIVSILRNQPRGTPPLRL